jgi:hypothetical protein
MLLLLRFTGHKKILGLGLSFLQIRHQRREASAAGSATTKS